MSINYATDDLRRTRKVSLGAASEDRRCAPPHPGPGTELPNILNPERRHTRFADQRRNSA